VKVQVHSQTVNTLNELNTWIIAAIADVTKGMLQRIWQEMGYRCDVRRVTDGAH
jgi:hypothetical protein